MSCSTSCAEPSLGLAQPSLVLVGCTATGKSDLALALARVAGDIELLSADSMQVYRGMDIGTAKPTSAERSEITHHLIDLVEVCDTFSLGEFQRAASAASAAVAARGHRSVLVGGTGLYLQAMVDHLTPPGQFPEVRAELEAEPDSATLHRRLARLDPVAAARMEPTNRRRVVRALEVTLGAGRPFSSFGPGLAAYQPTVHRLVGLTMARAELDARIATRYEAQLEAGWLEEIDTIEAATGGQWSDTAAQALGYREFRAHRRGECALPDALDAAVARTRRFARRQERWFRRDPRIHWLDAMRVAEDPMAAAAALLEDWPSP